MNEQKIKDPLIWSTEILDRSRDVTVITVISSAMNGLTDQEKQAVGNWFNAMYPPKLK